MVSGGQQGQRKSAQSAETSAGAERRGQRRPSGVSEVNEHQRRPADASRGQWGPAEINGGQQGQQEPTESTRISEASEHQRVSEGQRRPLNVNARSARASEGQ
ncbi:MAG: hypothetical protein HETSPECPRED_002880 [Heterodermia speciosa]|uniref:Uncharacterized protein n=1 Tax=Heterodermia speciosa TaxID=116794 RepID=A0A8H3J617_9LECA|nr:MAG: hypothetical protein HETSPECPRED_002880 [Heterodermia speciosa]